MIARRGVLGAASNSAVVAASPAKSARARSVTGVQRAACFTIAPVTRPYVRLHRFKPEKPQAHTQ
jgi:hypothetical protein